MARLLTEDGAGALEGSRILVLCADPVGAFDVAERLERAGAEAVNAFDLRQLSSALHGSLPDAAVSELSREHSWPSVAIALLHQLAVPQVLGATDRQRDLLRPKMPNAVFVPTPLRPADAVLTLGLLLRSNWPRLLWPEPGAVRPLPRPRPAAALSLASSRS